MSTSLEPQKGAPPWRDHLPYGGPREPPAEWSRHGGVMATQARAKGQPTGFNIYSKVMEICMFAQRL